MSCTNGGTGSVDGRTKKNKQGGIQREKKKYIYIYKIVEVLLHVSVSKGKSQAMRTLLCEISRHKIFGVGFPWICSVV